VTTINLPNDMPRFLSVKDTAARKNCPFSEASLRHLIFYAEDTSASTDTRMIAKTKKSPKRSRSALMNCNWLLTAVS
jgi:hypothetical protein